MEALKSASGNVEATNIALTKILNSLMQGNAEHALAQQTAVAATSDLAVIAQNTNDAFRQLMMEVNYNVVGAIRGYLLFTHADHNRLLWLQL
jgi:hypothetical protein